MELRATLDEIEGKALPIIARSEAADGRDAADRLVGAVAAGGLGVGRIGPVRRALEMGQGLELLLDAAGPPSDDEANELVRSASRADTRITFVPGHEGLRRLGGVGLLLRFRA
jgi:hypothetical protein